MKITQLRSEEALASLHSARAGLSTAEAARRLVEFGPNRVEEAARQSLAVRFISQFTHFFALILWLAAGLAFYAEWRDPGGGDRPVPGRRHPRRHDHRRLRVIPQAR